MSYSVVYGKTFKRNLKRLEKKYRHARDDVRDAIDVLQDRPRLGDLIRGSDGARKLRVRNRDARKGKRGGYRLIYAVDELPERVLYMLMLFSKSEQEDVATSDVQVALDEAAATLEPEVRT